MAGAPVAWSATTSRAAGLYDQQVRHDGATWGDFLSTGVRRTHPDDLPDDGATVDLGPELYPVLGARTGCHPRT
ncbi:hypothetical protein HJG43_01730 [Kineosporiaceae bacterium SCSIO 59966]|nr:hypothetical protein HJG43_01730 [Kineosporiaceae bacterium SCSIO 59966]